MKNSKDAETPKEPELEIEAETPGEPDTQAAESAKENAGNKKELSEAEMIKLLLQSQKAEIERLQKELDAAKADAQTCKSQTDTLNQRLANTLSEYENYRRRTASEKEALSADASAKAVKALLPALDSLARAIDFAEADPASFQQGVEMTLKQMEAGFSALGVVEIEAEAGQAFDPDRHNAVAHVDDDSLGESVVAEVFQKGYAIGDKVIRHSVVKVAN
ncbi:nucleotide exchange factor GrpE [Ethanoligenens harbinense]|uniref:Protein GrpE n=1 Tax=Ethanoligenens harbinense (strain DSM 18485 / JCM 12961 / CGMCC 1.5033 / YUAN-3) TaxID=663278 RepID=E6U8T3_ETHHY|nr:nucleotide exchange factor GrpE [Ethanoligenens harbinense]ADU27168.1 GrpE protein [Ethanoligenens harbinense YUAN-3]AVQ96237.1 nucleotide exchange factor GrpE [Ethanoligenens harbinense YUAN-3]AYF38897.1 nucleotide exchange factor GrpE [Ethanoligenens harbinense]AYF41647.1 nucleotide exchange factor GrpE [Ethanoligenens harbinense]QCN92478.1 nucleotide exchange factor GrpE [Ethanoligenens harbinense]